MFEKIRKGIRNPSEIPPYLVRRLVESDPGTHYRRVRLGGVDIYTWDDNFDWGHASPPETSANNYYVYKSLQHYLDATYGRALEVGCGWGNVTSWVSEFADETCGLDPNRDALSKGDEHYPHIEFARGVGQSLPYGDGAFDLVLTVTVLQHVSPADITAVADEITRVLSDDGTLLIHEEFDAEAGRSDSFYPRARERYRDLFSPLSVADAPEPDSGLTGGFLKMES